MAAAPWGQSGNCQSGSEWHHTLALAILATAGNCHWGPEWLPHGYLWLLLLFYFLYKNEKIRWFPCGTWRYSGSFIAKMVWECTAGFIFFLFLSILSKLFILEQLFFRWFHVVPVVFGSFMLTCYLEPSWFPFFKILSPGGETNQFCKKKWIF